MEKKNDGFIDWLTHPPMNKQLSPMEIMIEYLNGLLKIEDDMIIKYSDNLKAVADIKTNWQQLNMIKAKATELLTSSKVVTTEEVYRWEKLSERLPEYDTLVYVKGYERGDRVYVRKEWCELSKKYFIKILDRVQHLSSYEEGHKELEKIEWLRPVSLSDLIREAYWQGERDKGAEFTDNERTYADANDYINSITNTGNNG